MKKLLTILIVCVLCVCCAFGFTACDINDLKNSVNEIINGQTQDEENNNENNEEEKVVITKDTDFDALASDKVEKDVFINALMFSFIHLTVYSPAQGNCTVDIYETNGETIFHVTRKFDELKVLTTVNHVNFDIVIYDGQYILLSKDFKYYVQCLVGYIDGEMITEVSKVNNSGYITDKDIESFRMRAEQVWEHAMYNETTKQYEISQFEVNDGGGVLNAQIKIKDGYIVLLKGENDGDTACYKFYDIGATVVDIPADILAAMNAVK